MKNNEHLRQYEAKLTEILVGQCSEKSFLSGHLLEVEELDEKWSIIAPEYMIDAVPLVNDYPAVAIAWAAYIGMGLASIWDGAWENFGNKPDLYATMRNARGFDEMDEYVMEELLGIELNSTDYELFEGLLRSCAHTAMALIRNERFEPQSADAFYVFAATAKVFFRLGVAIELKQLGYEYRKLKVEVPETPSMS